jgi:hypothetical protein
VPESRKRKKRKTKASRLGRELGEYVHALRRAAAAALGEPPTECRIQAGWEDCGMANIVAIWRRGSTGLVAGYLVDLLGLGLKDGYLGLLESRADWARFERVEWETCPLETVQELVFGGLEWALRHGFRVPEDALEALTVLPPPARRPDLSRFGGKDGEPLLILRDPAEIAKRLGAPEDGP